VFAGAPMKLSSILRLYRARLRARVVLVQELFAVLGLAVGVALLFASQVASASLDGSVAQLASGVVGQARLQLLARDQQGFSEGLFGAVRRLPGVRAAVPVLEQRANVSGPGGEESVDLIASDPRYAQIAGPLLRHFSAAQLSGQQALALSSQAAQTVGAQPLQTVVLRLGGSAQRTLVGAELGGAEIGALTHSPIALAPISYVQNLAGMGGRVTRILVQPRAGHEAQVRAELVRLAAGAINVEPADSDATYFSQAAGPIDQSLSTFSAIGALVGFMFAYCAMLLTVPLRRGLIRDLRRDGATHWMTVKTLLFDALVLGVLGAVLGLALGDLLSVTLLPSNPGYLTFAFPVGSQRIVTWQSIALAAGAGLAAACVGVLTPLRNTLGRALRLGERPTQHLAGERTREALIAGLLCLAATVVILLAAPQSAVLAIVLLIVALLLFLAPLLTLVLAAFERMQRLWAAGAARLAVVELRSPPAQARSLAIAATGAIAVFAGVTIEGATDNLQRGLDRLFHEVSTVGDIWVVPPGTQNLLATTPFHGAPLPALARLPGVRAVGVYRASFLDFGKRRVWVLAPPSSGPNPVPANQLVGGASQARVEERLRSGNWAVISKAVAGEHDLRVGATFTLPAPRPTSFRVAALSTNLGWPPGAVILGSQAYVHAWGSNDPSAYNVLLAPGAAAASVRAEIQHTLGPNTGLVAETAQQREAQQRAASRRGLERLSQIAVLVLIAGTLAIAVAMSAMIAQRRAQLARMKLEGFPRRGLWYSLILESSLLLGSGCSLGAVSGIYGQLLLSHALLTVTGFPVIFSIGALTAVVSFALVTATAAAIIAVPGYRAASVRPYPAT
jgi:putative ABC transport system permease protein